MKKLLSALTALVLTAPFSLPASAAPDIRACAGAGEDRRCRAGQSPPPSPLAHAAPLEQTLRFAFLPLLRQVLSPVLQLSRLSPLPSAAGRDDLFQFLATVHTDASPSSKRIRGGISFAADGCHRCQRAPRAFLRNFASDRLSFVMF